MRLFLNLLKFILLLLIYILANYLGYCLLYQTCLFTIIFVTIHTSPRPPPFSNHWNHLGAGNKPHQVVAKFSKIYGPLMTLKLGSITTIIISSPDIAKEALQKKRLSLLQPNYHRYRPSSWPPQSFNGVVARIDSLEEPQESFCHENICSTTTRCHISPSTKKGERITWPC